ncbi:reverse transcriptase [Senna tora]|uniref:Reverse transcriptase n=1 Tax=Senna tora TaxID=362788 RepID=A0A834WST5_9FABA|nr:reverse transcriptase [Senna tora]
MAFSHLLFVDDVLLFARADKESVKAVKSVLDYFHEVSGLTVQKSSIWFSNNTPEQCRSEIANTLNFKRVGSLGKYLGFPLGTSGKAKDFKGIIDKISGKMDVWKSKFLSPIGKITLINSVANPMASYFMQDCDNIWARVGQVALNLNVTRNTVIGRCLRKGPLNANENELRISDIVNNNGSWKWDQLSFNLPEDICQKLQALHMDPNSSIDDATVWSGNVNVLVNDLPVRGNLVKRGMAIPPMCPLCNQSVESADHLFRVCTRAIQMWTQLNPSFTLLQHSDFNLWIKINCQSQSPTSTNIPHGTLFIYLLWHLWNARNKTAFENINFNAYDVIFLAKGKAGEFFFLSMDNDRRQSQPNQTTQIRWHPPPQIGLN